MCSNKYKYTNTNINRKIIFPERASISDPLWTEILHNIAKMLEAHRTNKDMNVWWFIATSLFIFWKIKPTKFIRNIMGKSKQK